MERNFLLTIEYDGSGFSGWQRQPQARTVQGELEEVLTKVCGGKVTLNGTSRTDAGVHALGQRASFSGEYGIPTEKIALAANNILAGGNRIASSLGDIRILSVEEKPADFHARFDSKGKKYRYIISNDHEPDIFRRKYCYHVGRPLDINAMRAAAEHIVGIHDFACFHIIEKNKDIWIEISGDGFLYNMVRIIAGTLVETGLGMRRPEDMAGTIESKNRSRAGHRAPAEGLYLVEVYYE